MASMASVTNRESSFTLAQYLGGFGTIAERKSTLSRTI